eukprot:309089-Heterocapsa_arctica.AAC.1
MALSTSCLRRPLAIIIGLVFENNHQYATNNTIQTGKTSINKSINKSVKPSIQQSNKDIDKHSVHKSINHSITNL